MTSFTPVSATIGGMLIGLAAVALMAFNGRILGLSGILAQGLLSGRNALSKPGWQLWFIAGVLLGPLLVWLLGGQRPAFDLQASVPLILLGGLLVGFGVRLGSGCTSGHGICGLSRLSRRSAVAVLCFMASAVITFNLLAVF